MSSENLESVDGGISDRGRDHDSDKDKNGSKGKSAQAKSKFNPQNTHSVKFFLRRNPS